MSQKRIFTRFNGYHPCGFGKYCSCNPTPKEKRLILHPQAKTRQKRFDMRFYSEEDNGK